MRYSISGGDEEKFFANEEFSHKVNLEQICPCDKTENYCDPKCCCDEVCLHSMFDIEYYNKNSECDPLSSVNNRIDSRLDYCEGHKKTIDDLYNPLVLAFKILKKGFCLAKKNPKIKNNDKSKNYDDIIDKIEKRTQSKSQDISFEEVLRTEAQNFNIFNNIDNFKKMAFNAPISLPNGLCLFNSFPIKKFMDYEVECSYHKSQANNIINYYNDNTLKKYLIRNSSYSEIIGEENNIYIKKVEITYFQINSHHVIKHYYEEVSENEDYIDFIFVVKFLYNNETDYIRSGNPGYIKGKPLLIVEEANKKIEKYENDIVFPINSSIASGDFYYYNNYFDNKLTFEDLIIYRYQNLSVENFSSNFLKNNNKIGKFGSANISYLEDWEQINERQDIIGVENTYLLIGHYKDVGAVNNTQFQIRDFQRFGPLTTTANDFYFITKFFKLKTQKDWWYAKGPGFIKLPKNIMYPFRIGTTDYESKKR